MKKKRREAVLVLSKILSEKFHDGFAFAVRSNKERSFSHELFYHVNPLCEGSMQTTYQLKPRFSIAVFCCRIVVEFKNWRVF